MRQKAAAMGLAVFAMVASSAAVADPTQDNLLARVRGGAGCEMVPNNGLHCTYRISKVLDVSIKDVGGSDTVVAFNASTVDSELYAVYYQGCVAVVPGRAYKGNYSRSLAAYISPKTGQVYSDAADCRNAAR